MKFQRIATCASTGTIYIVNNYEKSQNKMICSDMHPESESE